jgi:hypothetical protein
MKPTDAALSRREFARRAALGTAAVATGSAAWSTPASTLCPGGANPQTTAASAKLSAQSAAEAEARYQTILQEYGDRFSDAQKADIKHVCLGIQENLDKVRAYSLSNGDQPALYLKPLVEREKKSGAPNLKMPPAAGTAKPSASAERSDEWRVASDENSQESGNQIWAGPNLCKPGSGKP